MAFITVHHFAIWGYFIGNEVHTVQPNTVRFYALGLFIILLVCGQLQFNTDLMWRSLFPTIRSMYWVITIYAILYIFSGYLSRFLGHLRRAQAVSFIAPGVLIFMVLPTFLKGWGSQLTDLLPVFFFGLYLRMYGVSKRLTTLLKVLLGVTVVIEVLSIGLSDMIGNNRPESQAIADATSYFVTGSSAVAIYLIQDYEPFHNTLWQNIFHVRDFANTMATPTFIGYSFFVMVVIVIGAILIDKLLRYILMRPAQVLLALEMLATRYVTRGFKKLIKVTGYQPEH